MKRQKRCVIIGASGQLGRALASFFSKDYAIVEAVRRHPRADQVLIDLNDTAATTEVLKSLNPDLILIAGAYTNVDRCEEDAFNCHQVNAAAPLEIAHYARKEGKFVVYYSTDHAFDGSKPSSYTESDPVHPLNVYGRSKVEGEEAVRQEIPNRHLILRTSWLYGPDFEERNFPLRLIKRLQGGERVPVPMDQWGSPTFTEDLAAATHFLIERTTGGTFHVRGPDFINRSSYARQIALHFGLREDQLIPMPTTQLKQIAPRTLKIQLNCQKFKSLGGPPMRSAAEGLIALKGWRADFVVAEGIRKNKT